MTNRPILVTGASGFVGEHLTRHLVAKSHAVVGTYLNHELVVPGAEMRRVDLTDANDVRALLRDIRPRAIANLAALTNVASCEEDPDVARRSIVDVTRNIIDALRDAALHVPNVALSTDLVFDGQRAPYQEDDVPNPLSTYGKLKLAAESLVLSYAAGIVLRSALIYGEPSTHAVSCLGWMRRTLESGQELTLFADEFRTPIAVDDLCVGIETMLMEPRAGLWHAGGANRLSRLEMGQGVAEVFGYPERLLAPRRLSESTYGAPRPADTSLVSSRLWEICNHSPKNVPRGNRANSADFEHYAVNLPRKRSETFPKDSGLSTLRRVWTLVDAKWPSSSNRRGSQVVREDLPGGV